MLYLIKGLEGMLVEINSGIITSELEKAKECQQAVMEVAELLIICHNRRKAFTPVEDLDYRFAKGRVLIYLLYYDRLIRYLEGENAVPAWQLSDQFPPATYEDWTEAFKEASRLFGHFMRSSKMVCQ